MYGLQTTAVQCPCCWEQIELVIDCSVDDQTYTEDCSVCCRPMVVRVVVMEGELVTVDVSGEDD
ncbi:MAG: CPXCG motif-containing cysteine-rich protein [Marinobacter sp.]|nr:CPXCG motif-containing cysteine-rich protein [Marinobacter sp.]